MLIVGADLDGRGRDVRVHAGLVREIGGNLTPHEGEEVLDAAGGALLPGLWDHHVHLMSLAAARFSVRCGPPEVTNADTLAAALHRAPGTGWIRGIGFHESLGGDINRAWLDKHAPARPIRLQHRSGRMWILNTLALDKLNFVTLDGKLIDCDALLRERLRAQPPDLAPLGEELMRKGIVGVTDATPDNDRVALQRLTSAGLPQHLLVMGTDALATGPRKFHLHDHALPDLADFTRDIARAHDAGRGIAVHCVTHAALLFTLAALQDAGARAGDRIEHGAIITNEALDWIAQLGLTVVTQPHFLTERGDAYRADVPVDEQPFLYRLGSLLRGGIPTAAGSDAPFGDSDPWRSMHAAVERPDGFGDNEAITPEQALALFTTPPDAPGGEPRKIEVGARADLCLLDRPWSAARKNLAAVDVRAVWSGDAPVPAGSSTSHADEVVRAPMKFFDGARVKQQAPGRET